MNLIILEGTGPHNHTGGDRPSQSVDPSPRSYQGRRGTRAIPALVDLGLVEGSEDTQRYTLRGHERDVVELQENSRYPRNRLLGVLGWQSVENLWDGGLKVPASRVVATVRARAS